MTDDIYRTQLRLPIRVYERLRVTAEESGRSLNAEIAHRLEASLETKNLGADAGYPAERQKAELLMDFEAWHRDSKPPLDEKSAYREYCRLYNGDDPDQEEVDHVHGIEKVDPRFLRDLALAWRRYARESTYVHLFTDPTRPQRLAPERRKCELVVTYLRWCKGREDDPLGDAALNAFCDEYNSREKGKVLDLREVSPGYLEELVNTWLYSFPVQLAGATEEGDLIQAALNAVHKQQADKLQAIESAIRRFAVPSKPS